MAKVLLSFIIPTFNSEKTVEGCLSSIPRRDDIEVIVVDNFSSDSTGEICRRRGVRFYQIRSTIAKARNYGADRSKGDYVVRLDGDEAISKPLLDELIWEIRKCNPDIVWAFRVGMGYWQRVIEAINDAHSHYFHGKPYKLAVPLAYRRELFLKFKQDERLHWYEDGDQMGRLSPHIRNTVTLKTHIFHLPVGLKAITQKRIRLHKIFPSQPYGLRRSKMDAKSYAHRYLYILRRHPLRFPGAILLAWISALLRLIRWLKILSIGV